MPKEIIITNANNFHSFISFQINGLKDDITVGIVPDPNSHGQALSIAYKGEVKIVPLNAAFKDIEYLNKDEYVIMPVSMDNETYNWLTTPGEDDDVGYWQPDQTTELDDEAYDKLEKEAINPELDIERVETPDPEDLWKYERTHYGEPHLLELMDEWGVDSTNYADFRSVIQEHCLNKGLYAFNDIEKAWKSYKTSLKNAVKNITKND
jgi:hypothetical protein